MIKSAHEPEAKAMSAEQAWADAQQAAGVLRQNLLEAEPKVELRIPLSVFLSALSSLSQDELLTVRNRVKELLAV